MSKEKLRELGEDIKANRMRERIKLLCDGAAYILLDGRSRLDAHENVGLPIQIFYEGGKPNKRFFEVVDLQSLGVTAEAYVASMNVHRRHLTAEDRAQFLDRLIRLHPEKSNRQLAEEAGVSHPTVGKARERAAAEDPDVETPFHVDKLGRNQPASKPQSQQRLLDLGGGQRPAPGQSQRKGGAGMAAELGSLADEVIVNLTVKAFATLLHQNLKNNQTVIEIQMARCGRGVLP